jgi:hypothetical protein
MSVPVFWRSAFLSGLVLVVLVVCCVASSSAWAASSFEVAPGSFRVLPSSLQAGGHPDVTTEFGFAPHENGAVEGLVRDAEVVLPLGFAGYPALVATCEPSQLAEKRCPVGSQVGTLEVDLRARLGNGFYLAFRVPVFNISPGPNETAVYAFQYKGVIQGEIVVSVGPDYRVRARVTNILSIFEIVHQSFTLWGVPAAGVHDLERGSDFECQETSETPIVQIDLEARCSFGGNPIGAGHALSGNPVAYLVNPSQCAAGALSAELRGVDSWEGDHVPPVTTPVGPFTGCDALSFAPTFSLGPEESQAGSPSGYEINLKVPQAPGGEGVATPDLRDAVIRFPAGVVLSPSAATGLGTCSEAQVGLGSEAPVQCPNSSRLGSVSLITPALTGELKGALYLGGPPSGLITGPPFTVYLTLEGHGVLVKVPGRVTPDPVTGRITAVFDRNPELPFSELRVRLTGGRRATLANPTVCGSYQADADFTPWSSPFTPDALTVSPAFQVTGCGPAQFAPSFVAGTTSNQAGGYSSFSVSFSRQDADQQLGGVSVTTPPGLSGNLSNVPLCGEPQAQEGTCPEASRIGSVTAAAGPGPEPVYTTTGKVFLTGPYHGAPFGLTIDASEHAGPFDLGTGPCDCEVVRAAVNVDPHTAQLTVSSGALPTIKDGIPLQVKSVNVDVNRPGFMFNPTSCDPMAVGGSLSSTQGATASVASHFQVTNCAALKFDPSFKVATIGKTSKANGASLDVKLVFPSLPQGSEANIRKVKVELPKQLPSRLTTLQQACLAKVFEANPASCPAASIVGYAKAITPILPVPLTGPAYFVSHGGEAFPSLIIVLQGYGVTVELEGTTFISKAGITSSTFKTVPDVPVGSFELYLPQGRFSALTANTSLCKVKGGLHMPTEFVSQNNTLIRRSTAIAVTGCPKAKKARKAKRARKAGRARRATHANRRTHR